MKNYITISSDRDIRVTPGLGYKDVTEKDLPVANRLKVLPEWQKNAVLIKKGVGIYPSAIASWNTVKALVKLNVLTLGKECDNADGTDNPSATAKKVAAAEEKENG